MSHNVIKHYYRTSEYAISMTTSIIIMQTHPPRISAIMKRKAINDAMTNLILAVLLVTSLSVLWQQPQVTDGET